MDVMRCNLIEQNCRATDFCSLLMEALINKRIVMGGSACGQPDQTLRLSVGRQETGRSQSRFSIVQTYDVFQWVSVGCG